MERGQGDGALHNRGELSQLTVWSPWALRVGPQCDIVERPEKGTPHRLTRRRGPLLLREVLLKSFHGRIVCASRSLGDGASALRKGAVELQPHSSHVDKPLVFRLGLTQGTRRVALPCC